MPSSLFDPILPVGADIPPGTPPGKYLREKSTGKFLSEDQVLSRHGIPLNGQCWAGKTLPPGMAGMTCTEMERILTQVIPSLYEVVNVPVSPPGGSPSRPPPGGGGSPPVGGGGQGNKAYEEGWGQGVWIQSTPKVPGSYDLYDRQGGIIIGYCSGTFSVCQKRPFASHALNYNLTDPRQSGVSIADQIARLTTPAPSIPPVNPVTIPDISLPPLTTPRQCTGPIMFSTGDGAGVTVNIETVEGDVTIITGDRAHLPSFPKPIGPAICTKDVRQCPDGSYVGRIGPDCQFEPCPPGLPGDAMVRLVNNASEVAEQVFADGVVRQFLEGVGTGAWVWKQAVAEHAGKIRVDAILQKNKTYATMPPVTPGEPYPKTTAVIRFSGEFPGRTYVDRFLRKYGSRLDPMVAPGGTVTQAENISLPLANAEKEKELFELSMEASMDPEIGGEVVVSFDQGE